MYANKSMMLLLIAVLTIHIVDLNDRMLMNVVSVFNFAVE